METYERSEHIGGSGIEFKPGDARVGVRTATATVADPSTGIPAQTVAKKQKEHHADRHDSFLHFA
jgi:hypothetical protein